MSAAAFPYSALLWTSLDMRWLVSSSFKVSWSAISLSDTQNTSFLLFSIAEKENENNAEQAEGKG